MFRRNLIVSAVCLTFVPSIVAAQSAVSQSDQEACTPDVFRLCQDFIPNEAPIVACLESKRRELSPACQQVMFPTTRLKSADHRAHSKHRHKKAHAM